MLIHGARSALRTAQRRKDSAGRWMQDLLKRRHANVATVAMANKNARIVWALLAKERQYDAQHLFIPAVG